MRNAHPSRIEEDIKRLIAKERTTSSRARRLEHTDLVESVPGVSCAELPGLFAAYNRIWRW